MAPGVFTRNVTIKDVAEKKNIAVIGEMPTSRGRADYGISLLRGVDSNPSISMSGKDGLMRIGGMGSKTHGKISLVNKFDIPRISLGEEWGEISILDDAGNPKFQVKGYDSRLYIGGAPKGGRVIIGDRDHNEIIKLDGNPSGGDSISVRSIGKKNKSQNIFACSYTDKSAEIFLGAHLTEIGSGNPGKAGAITLRDMSGDDSILLNGRVKPGHNNIWIRDVIFETDGSKRYKNILACNTSSPTHANLYIGANSDEGAGIAGTISLRDWNGKDSIVLDGEKGDIFLSNADCAEEFDVSSLESSTVEPGTVMVMDNDGKLQRGSKPYDKRVAGVISGAGDCKPGIILDKKISKRKRMPVALVGKVYCKVDADYAKINIGDMLTTSSTPGYAMKASNRSKAFGAVIGKALHALRNGKSLIPILIALQ